MNNPGINDLAANLDTVLSKIEQAAQRAGRKGGEITLVAASKTQPPKIMQAYQKACAARGLLPVFGESYVQEFKNKRDLLEPPFSVHLIGHLQSNKAKEAVLLFDMIHSVGSLKTAEALEKEAGKRNITKPILLQVNISDDQAKSGLPPDETTEAARMITSRCPHLALKGLMAITRYYEQAGDVRPDYRALRELTDKLQRELGAPSPLALSMGMSSDYEIAIEEGATLVRIGSAIFGERIPG